MYKRQVRSFSNITDQINKLQGQFSKLLSRKTDESDQRKRAISVYMITANVIRWGREFIHFGIKPGELRHVKRFYDTNFKPLSLEQEFVQYFANKMAEIEIDSYEREHLNTIEQWSVALEHMSAIATRLLQTYKFSPDQVNDKSAGHASVLNLELDTAPWGGDGSSTVDINAITAGVGDEAYPTRIPPDPARLAQSGKPACQFFGTKHGCVLGSFCPNAHDVTSIATHPLGKVSCLNCGMIPTKQTVAHIQKDCWRHGSKAFDENRWVTELNERKQGAMLRKYEMLKEAQTKGNARASRERLTSTEAEPPSALPSALAPWSESSMVSDAARVSRSAAARSAAARFAAARFAASFRCCFLVDPSLAAFSAFSAASRRRFLLILSLTATPARSAASRSCCFVGTATPAFSIASRSCFLLMVLSTYTPAFSAIFRSCFLVVPSPSPLAFFRGYQTTQRSETPRMREGLIFSTPRGAGDGAKTRLTRARSVGARREGVHDAAFAASIVLRRRTSGQLGPRRAPPFLAKKCFHALFQSRLFALSSRD